MSLTSEIYDLIVKIIDDKVKEIKVTREEFDKLRKILDERFSKLEEATIKFTEAQKINEERFNELTKAINNLVEVQAKTEERIAGLEEIVKALAEAQQRTEERLDKLTKTVNNLAEAVNSLVEAQKRNEERMNELTIAVNSLIEAQKRNEERFGKLIVSLDNLRIEVGRLSETMGFGLEDIARVVLPGWLYKNLDIKVEEFKREFIKINDEEIEVNLYGEGKLKGKKVIVIGEVKSRIYGTEVKDFYNRLYIPIVKKMKTKVIGIIFGYLIHPSAKKLAKELKLHVVASYEK